MGGIPKQVSSHKKAHYIHCQADNNTGVGSLQSGADTMEPTTRRYPRYGYRLAPATLKELLQIPIPQRYLSSPENSNLRLCDLDESAWRRFDAETCHSLAEEILKVVGRAARMPMPIGNRQIPPLPKGMSLSDLPLEMRTVNCLIAADIYERPQDLLSMTVEGILGLQGFWAKCLVDLLTSIEYATDHPDRHPQLGDQLPRTIKAARISDHYPRIGQRIAPRMLREILSEPIPPDLVRGTAAEGLQLADLDEQTWETLPHDLISKLADIVVSRVNVSGDSRKVKKIAIPKLPKGVRLENIRLENRTHNCLNRAGFAKHPENLSEQTIGQLMKIKAFGAKCLVDLLCSIETLIDRKGNLDETLSSVAQKLGKIKHASSIHFSDPRLGPILRAIDSNSNTIGELVNRVLHRRFDPANPALLAKQIAEVCNRLSTLPNLSLEDELLQIFSNATNIRDTKIVAEYYGWDKSGGHTLEDLGQKYGLSRERIRQVCARAIKRNRDAKIFAPVLDRTLAFIAERIPITADKLKKVMQEEGSIECNLSFEGIQQATTFLSRESVFSIAPIEKTLLVVKPDCVQFPRHIIITAKRSVLSYGATTIGDISEEVSKQFSQTVDPLLVRATLETLEDFQWLDEKRGWFRLDTPSQYGLPNIVEKVLSVAGCIDAAKLRSAVARYRRTGKKVPPADVLLEFCRQAPGIVVERNMISSEKPLDWKKTLAGVEIGMVKVLKENGPVMERGELEELCAKNGMNRFSFNAVVMSSPVIAQYGRSVYGLINAKVDQKTLKKISKKNVRTSQSKVLHSYGRTPDGHPFLIYQLSKAAISGGVVTVPAAMKEILSGDFDVSPSDGAKGEKLVSKNGCAWGLGPVLRSKNSKLGDFMTIVFDLDNRKATINIGNRDIIEKLHANKE